MTLRPIRTMNHSFPLNGKGLVDIGSGSCFLCPAISVDLSATFLTVFNESLKPVVRNRKNLSKYCFFIIYRIYRRSFTLNETVNRISEDFN